MPTPEEIVAAAARVRGKQGGKRATPASVAAAAERIRGQSQPKADAGFPDALAPQRQADERAAARAQVESLPPPELPGDVQAAVGKMRQAIPRAPARRELQELLGRQYPGYTFDPRTDTVVPQEDKAAGDRAAGERVRTAVELGGSLALIPATKGLGLFPRAAAQAAGAGGLSLATEPLAPSKDPATRAGVEAGLAGFGEALGTALPLLGKTFRGGSGGADVSPLIKPAFKQDEIGRQAAEVVEAGGGVLPPAQQSSSRRAGLLQSFVEGTFFGSARLGEATDQARGIARRGVEKIAEDLASGLPKEQLASTVAEAVEGSKKLFGDAAAEQYGRVDEAAKAVAKPYVMKDAVGTPFDSKQIDVFVDPAPVKAAAQKRIAELAPRLDADTASKLLKRILALPERLTFREAQSLRSSLLALEPDVTDVGRTTQQAAAKTIAGEVDKAMIDAARKAGGDVEKAFREASTFYKQGAELFTRRAIKAIVRREKEAVLGVISAAKGSPESIRAVKQAVADPKLWRGVQGQFVEDLLQKSLGSLGDEGRDSVLKGQKIITALKQFGEPAARELLGSEKYDELVKAARVLERVDRRTGSRIGGIGIRTLSDLSGMYAIVSGDVAVGAGVIVPPYVLGELLTKPAFVSALTRGIDAPAGSLAASRAFGQIATMVQRIEAQQKAPAKRQDSRLPTPSIFGTVGGPRAEAEPRIGR